LPFRIIGVSRLLNLIVLANLHNIAISVLASGSFKYFVLIAYINGFYTINFMVNDI